MGEGPEGGERIYVGLTGGCSSGEGEEKYKIHSSPGESWDAIRIWTRTWAHGGQFAVLDPAQIQYRFAEWTDVPWLLTEPLSLVTQDFRELVRRSRERVLDKSVQTHSCNWKNKTDSGFCGAGPGAQRAEGRSRPGWPAWACTPAWPLSRGGALGDLVSLPQLPYL